MIRADVGEGKSKIAECILRWGASARSGVSEKSGVILVPNNVLLQQYLDTCRGLDTLRRQDLYECVQQEGLSCADRKKLAGRCCAPPGGNHYGRGACPYVRDLRRSRSSQKMCLTYHAALAHQLEKDVVVVDEAHNLRPFLRELASVRIWQHEVRWPGKLRDVESTLRWLHSDSQPEFEDADLLYETLTGPQPKYMLDFSPQAWRGRQRECISLIPLDVRKSTGFLSKAKKLVLLSATFNRLDVAALGLDRKRVTYIDLPSSIPPEQRPIVYYPVADMRFAGREAATQRMAKWILDEYLPQHVGEKGLIHATYGVAAQLRELAAGDPQGARLLFHTKAKASKTEALARFLASDPADGLVLVGSGMHEGLDLRGDLGRHQLITSVPRDSIADPATAWLAENDPDAYEWETVRRIIQASGRVCRGADDSGTTVIADASFGAREMQSRHLPDSWREALILQSE